MEKAVESFDISERIDGILCFLKKISDCQNNELMEETILEHFGNDIDLKRIKCFIPQECQNTQKYINLLTEYLIIFLLTDKYLDEIWDCNILENSAIANCEKVIDDCFSELLLKELSLILLHEAKDKTNFIQYGIRGVLTNKLLACSFLKDVNLIERLTDSVIFKNKHTISNKKPLSWIADFSEIKEKEKNQAISQMSQKTNKAFLHSITHIGNNHDKCDDYSDNLVIGEDIYFAYVSDGVGSSPFSDIGSKMLGESFCEIIYKKQKTKDMLSYMFSDFSNDLFCCWERKIKEYCKKENKTQKSEPFNLFDYAATFLFTLKYKNYIFCGMLGDGNFIVEKVYSDLRAEKKYGYFELTDGFSGVVQNSVFTIATLKTNPRALRINVFDSQEISAILMTSDGASAIKSKSLDDICLMDLSDYLNAKQFFKEMRLKEFDEQKNYINELAYKYSLSNMTAGGRGDDCSISFIQIK